MILVGIYCLKNKIYSMGMILFVLGIITISLGLWTNFIPYLTCMAIGGIIWPYYNALFITLMQEKVEKNYLGRVLSVFTMISSAATLLGMLFFGSLGDILTASL